MQKICSELNYFFITYHYHILLPIGYELVYCDALSFDNKVRVRWKFLPQCVIQHSCNLC